MKRCPQCHFTFGDDQQFCDFDHSELTFLPEPSGDIPAPPPDRFQRALRSHLAVAILALASAVSVLLIGYLYSDNESVPVISSPAVQQASTPLSNTPREKPQHALIEPTKTNRPKSISTQRKLTRKEEGASMPSSILKWEPKTATASTNRRDQSVSKRAVRAHVGSSKRFAAASNKTVRTKSARSNKDMYARNHEGTRSKTPTRKDSKVVAILKKTGSILTRPFRF